MTMAVGIACVNANTNNEEEFKRTLCEMMREIVRQYPDVGYGGDFYDRLMSDDAGPYGSFGNGSAMRVSPTAYAARSLEDAKRLARLSAEVTHDHPERIREAEAVAAAIFLAAEGSSRDEIREYISRKYYDLDFTLDDIRPAYSFDVSCEASVPQAIECFLEARDFEDALRNAISLGGDGDTIAAIAGAIAEAYFGIPDDIAEKAFEFMDETEQEYYDEYADELYRMKPKKA